MTDRPLEAPYDLAIEVPSELRPEDSLYALLAPVRPFSTALAVLLLVSLLVHAFFVATAVIDSDRTVAVATNEIPIEIVSERAPAQPTKAESAKKAAASQESVKQEAAKPEATKQETPKPPEPAKPPKPIEQAKSEPPKPLPNPTATPKSPPRADTQAIDALQKELAALKAEQAALRAEPQPAVGAASAAGDGPLAGSLRAIAMPGASETGDDAVAYQDLVFSQLAKAKGVGEYHGAEGTTGVRFAIDEAGQLLSVDVSVSSGNAQLDAEALTIVRRAAPFPAPPKDAQRTFVANVNFVPPKPKL